MSTVVYESGFDSDTVGQVIRRLGDTVEDLVDGKRRLLNSVRELADNAIFHSGAGRGWCIAEKEGSWLAVTVRDRGIGLHRSMKRYYPDIDESLAVSSAFRGGVTSTQGEARGLGLMMVIDYTATGARLLFETGGVAFVGVGGQGHILGKSTRVVEGVTATLAVPLTEHEKR